MAQALEDFVNWHKETVVEGWYYTREPDGTTICRLNYVRLEDGKPVIENSEGARILTREIAATLVKFKVPYIGGTNVDFITIDSHADLLDEEAIGDENEIRMYSESLRNLSPYDNEEQYNETAAKINGLKWSAEYDRSEANFIRKMVNKLEKIVGNEREF